MDDFVNMSEVDVAYKILMNNAEPIHYRDLILDVIEKKHKPVQSLSAAISEVYTMINMDSRFQYRGDCMWGLTEWNPPESKRSTVRRTSTVSPKTTSRRREKMFESIQE